VTKPRSVDVTERYSPARAWFFALYFRRYFVRRMNALRVCGTHHARQAAAGAGPLILYTNHPSWWDAALYVVLPGLLFPGRRHYAPMDREMLEKYRFFARIGAYGVDLARPAGAAEFFRQSARILARGDSLLWISAQGRFSDPRERPVGLKAGVARLCEANPEATVVPVAFDYAFWTERGAEAFAAFGAPMRASDLIALDRDARLRRLEDRLTETLDGLAVDVVSRDPARFEALLEGRAGVGGVYELWKRASARFAGGRWSPEHGKGAPGAGLRSRR
jgi:1-acyl-sn-glycerol-3-phosphate acyltransferase